MKPPTKKVTRLVTRHLRLLNKGRAYYEKASLALQEARYAGLAVDQPVEITLLAQDGATQQTDRYHLVDNFEGKEVAFRPASVRRFEIKKLPKNPRPPKPEPEEAA